MDSDQNVKIVFVTGKGGVGKSSVALAWARREAKKGRKTLLVELGAQSYYADFLGLKNVSNQPQELGARLELVHLTGERCLREYVLHYLKLERLYRVFFENRVMKTFIGVAPGLDEVSILGKITSGIRQIGPPFPYESIVVDCFSTGHALALFRAPVGLAKVIRFGPMGEQCSSIERILKDSTYCQYVIVSLLEELPIAETVELYSKLKNEFNAQPTVICNKVWNPPLSSEDLQELEEKFQNADSALVDFAHYLKSTIRRQQNFLSRLKNKVGDVIKIDLQFTRDSKKLIAAMEAHLDG